MFVFVLTRFLSGHVGAAADMLCGAYPQLEALHVTLPQWQAGRRHVVLLCCVWPDQPWRLAEPLLLAAAACPVTSSIHRPGVHVSACMAYLHGHPQLSLSGQLAVFDLLCCLGVDLLCGMTKGRGLDRWSGGGDGVCE
jgi:hypothetical protein